MSIPWAPTLLLEQSSGDQSYPAFFVLGYMYLPCVIRMRIDGALVLYRSRNSTYVMVADHRCRYSPEPCKHVVSQPVPGPCLMQALGQRE